MSLTILEYEKVKEEMLFAITAQQTTLNYGIAAMAIVFTGVLSTWSNAPLRTSILSLAPIFVAGIWFIWLGELIRMARAARFLWELERLLNKGREGRATSYSDLSPENVLHWEGWVRGANRWHRSLHLGLSYIVSTCLVFGIGLVSSVLGVVFSFTEHVSPALRGLTLPSAAFFGGLAVTGAVMLLKNPVLQRGRPDDPPSR
ncbi:hypothetical protein [Frankia sp. R82]|uniref:hypothetical protein n=1 Tax=Frankia sp. R82 TaxID=2950553 RepID=UPI0020448312|nr:hypothetical protein [Frankia sp. R82]MCM3887477.1 hypothetical protein [Frankia sp. R82]